MGGPGKGQKGDEKGGIRPDRNGIMEQPPTQNSIENNIQIQ